ncbi:MAG: pectate lyase [Deltaproteobacteria bacterium]
MLALTLSSGGCGGGGASRDLGHEVLGAEDGWASVAPGTTGGEPATPDQIYVVHSRAELLAALNDGVIAPQPPPPMRGEPRLPPPAPPSDAPKIIVVEGTLDFNVDDANQPLSCEDYYRDGYTPQAFDAAYIPEVWGRNDPRGPLEDARETSSLEQQNRIRMRVGSNTTLVGRGADARLRGVWLDIRGSTGENASNIIIRNLTFEDTFDCFPEWWPTDGFLGSWNAQYDTISLRHVDHVWIDHNTFRDRETLDALQAERLLVKYQTHADELEIRSASDLLTISYNRFMDHDQVMMIGSSDSATGDRGTLRVTLHHNLFRSTGQGTPRVRFGQVHLYNNLYDQVGNDGYSYSWGAGFESAFYAQNNFFATDASLTPDRFIRRFDGTSLFETGTMVDVGEPHAVDLVEAWNENNDPDLTRDVGWWPARWSLIEGTSRVSATVSRESGPIDW